MVIPCEPQIRCMRASDTTYVAEEVEAFLSRENKSGKRALQPASSFLPSIMYALRLLVH